MDRVYGDLKPTISILKDSDVGKVNSKSWDQMSFAELHDELDVLTQRYENLLAMRKLPLANQMLSGMQRLEMLLRQRELQQEITQNESDS